MKRLAIAILFFWCGMTSVVHAKKIPAIKCTQFYNISNMVADSKAMLSKVDYIMHRESKCNELAFNPDDPMGGSFGLFQINGFWCKPNQFTKQGYLQDVGVLTKCKDLYNPIISAKAFMAIYNYADRRYGDGFGPWGGEPWN